jgi:TolB protein
VYENWNYEINIWQAAIGADLTPASAAQAVTRNSELWNLYPQVSPDGAYVAYVSTQTGSHELWIAQRDGSNPRQMTHVRRGVVKSPRWSPDSRRVVYLASGQGTVDVQHVDITTGAISRVTATPANEVAPAWSHDGARIFFGATDANGAWNVWSVDALGGESRIELANAVAAQPSSDGSVLYYTRPDQPGVWRHAHAGQAQDTRIVADVAAGNTLGWLVTARGIYFLVERNDAVYLRRSELDGRDARDVATLTHFTWPGFSLTPDEGAVLYARWDRRDSNLMSIEY